MSAQPTATGSAPGFVTIEIDGKVLQAPKGAMVIQVADRAGIPIPRFCYHRKLPIAANCRQCMVEVEMGGRKSPKPQVACATPVAEGMKVFTRSPLARSAQRNAMEFLLINHPLDCPICDQGGECELQDVSLGFGRSIGRFTERKRVVADEDIGPLVATEMTRCIHCTRCVRVLSEITGSYEFGDMDRGDRHVIGTYIGRPLVSELSGNVIEVCPVGALTDKVFRFKARAWELLARKSIGYHDALGSNLWLHTRRGEVLRAVPRDNEAINECWLSDRDRYSHQALRSPDRTREVRVKRNGVWQKVGWDEGLRVAAEALREVPRGELRALVHPATSNEEGWLLGRLVRALGSGSIDFRLRRQDFRDGAVPRTFGMPLAAVEKAHTIVLVGCNPRLEMPLLGARVRKAVLGGAKVFSINPVDFDLNFTVAGRRIVPPGALLHEVIALARAVLDLGHGSKPAPFAAAIDAVQPGDGVRGVAKALGEGAVLVLGETALDHPEASRIRFAVDWIAQATGSAVNEIPVGPNALGLAAMGALPGPDDRDAASMLDAAGGGVLLYGCDPPFDFADGARLRKALEGAGTVVAFAAFASKALEDVADVILPIGLLPEIDATLVNVDGTAQVVAAGSTAPGDARPGWKALRALGSGMGLEGFDFVDIAEVRSAIGAPPAAPHKVSSPPAEAAAVERSAGTSTLERIATTAIYGVDAIVRRAPALQAHPLSARKGVTLNPEDALALGLRDSGTAQVEDVVLPVEISPRVPRGAAWIEAGHAETAGLPPHGSPLRIRRTGADA
ncbi:MAG: NADH-quinone oxidoreductase subunit NuoG [Lysobacterales bacterium]